MTKRFLVIDTETGGLDPRNNSLLTAYFGIFNDKFEKIGELDLKIKPDDGKFRVTEQAMKVNGINLEQHAKEAMTETEAGIRVAEFLGAAFANAGEKLTVVGHNVHFDLNFLHNTIILSSTWEKNCDKIVLDTMIVGQFMKLAGCLPPNIPNSLGSYLEFFGIKKSGLHNAKTDAVATMSVLKHFKKYLEGTAFGTNSIFSS